MKISYGITVCNENIELKKLLKHLANLIDATDEVIVLVDYTNTTDAVMDVIKEYRNSFSNFVLLEKSLNGNFAAFKNHLIEAASGDYLFQIDADEIPNDFLIENIKPILKVNSTIDCFYIPRVNKVIGLTPQHIAKWRWRVDEQERVNFPDPQMRLFKLDKGIKWKNKVHEVLTGYQTITSLPYEEDFCLMHIKSIDKQERQNNFYDTL